MSTDTAENRVEITGAKKRVGARCPDCGGRMTEVMRAEERKGVFVWFKCASNDCEGTALRRFE